MPKLRRTSNRAVGAALSVCALVASAVLAVMALSDGSGDSRERPTVVTDDAALSVWKSTLSPALDDLNSFQDPPKVPSDDPARIRPCAIDDSDGSLVQLSAEKYWATASARDGFQSAHVLPEVRTGYAEIVKSMVARGWTDQTGARGESGDGADEPARTTVTKTIENVRVTLWIDMYTSQILATLTFPDAPSACRLAE